ncbi:MAG: hypothetical protein IJI98_07670 [Methanosphaera sp.]|nr:hypothetical protein [Methanosphaera sp.]
MVTSKQVSYDFTNVNLKNFDLYGVFKHKRYTLTALDNLYKFSQEYLTALHDMKKKDEGFDYEPYHSRVAYFSNNVTHNLNISNLEDLNKFLSIIRISKRLLNKSITTQDFECLQTSFSTLEYNLEQLNI